MVRETDLPCSDCNSPLVETVIEENELSLPLQGGGDVLVAECSECGARYIPESTLDQLTEATNHEETNGGA